MTTTDHQRRVLSACREFAENFDPHQRRTLWLIGGVGTGKTHLAAAIVNELIANKQMLGVVIPAREIVRSIREKWGTPQSGQHEYAVLTELATADLLIVDEVGAGANSESE